MKNTIALLTFTVLGLVLTLPAHAVSFDDIMVTGINCQGTSEPVKSQFPPQDTLQPVEESSS